MIPVPSTSASRSPATKTVSRELGLSSNNMGSAKMICSQNAVFFSCSNWVAHVSGVLGLPSVLLHPVFASVQVGSVWGPVPSSCGYLPFHLLEWTHLPVGMRMETASWATADWADLETWNLKQPMVFQSVGRRLTYVERCGKIIKSFGSIWFHDFHVKWVPLYLSQLSVKNLPICGMV